MGYGYNKREFEDLCEREYYNQLSIAKDDIREGRYQGAYDYSAHPRLWGGGRLYLDFDPYDADVIKDKWTARLRQEIEEYHNQYCQEKRREKALEEQRKREAEAEARRQHQAYLEETRRERERKEERERLETERKARERKRRQKVKEEIEKVPATPQKGNDWDEKAVDKLLKKHDGQWVLFDHAGNVIGQKCYDIVCSFCEGRARVVRNGKRGFIDQMGQEVVACKYEKARDFREGLSRVALKGKYGFIDMQGNLVVPCKYDDANDFSEGLARVKYKGKYGYVDAEGNEVIPCEFDDEILPHYTGDFHDELAAARNRDSDYVYINMLGEVAIASEYDMIYDFKDGRAQVKIVDGDSSTAPTYYRFIDTAGDEIVASNKYDGANDFVNGRAVIRDAKSKKYGAIDRRGKEVVPCKYDLVCDFDDDGVATVEKNGKWGLVDLKGQEVVACKYPELQFSDGLGLIKKRGKYGYLDTKGAEAIPCNFEDAYAFWEGFALVSLPGQGYGFIDTTGRLIVPCRYDFDDALAYDTEDDVPAYKCGLALIARGDKYVLLNKKGVELLTFSTDYHVRRLKGMIALRR